jgi:hypothetical protein
VMTRWFEFLSFYVDQSIPKLNPVIRAAAPTVLEDTFGVPGLGFEPDRFFEADGVTPTCGDYAGCLATYQAESPVRVLYEVGASPDFPASPGAHRQRFEMNFPSWPPPDGSARTFFLGAGGTLVDAPPSEPGIDRYAFDPGVLDTHYFVSGDHGGRQVTNDWKVTPDGLGLAYETAPLTEDLVVAGEGYVDLWVRSTGSDLPLEVVLSEVYEDADGIDVEEVRVQNGLLRAGYRTLDPDRTNGIQIDHLYGADDYQPLPAGQFVNVKVPLYSVAHPFRAGSRLRIEINTPGGDSALWDFESPDYGATQNDVARGAAMASSIVLPVLPATAGRTIPAAFEGQAARPACDSLRGQPCRLYEPMVNQDVPVPPTTTTTTTEPPTSSTTTTSAPDPDPAPVGVEPAAVAQPIRLQPTFTG